MTYLNVFAIGLLIKFYYIYIRSYFIAKLFFISNYFSEFLQDKITLNATPVTFKGYL